MTLTDTQYQLGALGVGWAILWIWVWFDTRPKLGEEA